MPRVVINDARSLCADYVEQDHSIITQLESDGWSLHSNSENPVLADIGASRDYAGLGKADFYAFTETYPTRQLVFCLVDLYGADVEYDIAGIGADPTLVGEIVTTDAGVFGAWQVKDAAQLTLVQAYQNEHSFHYQITRVAPPSDKPWMRLKQGWTKP